MSACITEWLLYTGGCKLQYLLSFIRLSPAPVKYITIATIQVASYMLVLNKIQMI